ncbi:MAG: response regulator [Candidatus Omnitrophota bacterium]
MKRKKIVVIDDDPHFVEQFQEMLTLSGYDTECFTDPNRALTKINDIKPNLLLVDLKMDERSGTEILEEIRRTEDIKETPAIIITGFANEADEDYLLNTLKVRRCLKKPVKPLNIIDEIEHVFNDINHSH